LDERIDLAVKQAEGRRKVFSVQFSVKAEWCFAAGLGATREARVLTETLQKKPAS